MIQQTLVRLNDPYTRFLPPQAYRQLLLQTQGQQVDVGRGTLSHSGDPMVAKALELLSTKISNARHVQ
ncbi:hypothetical protein RHP47_06580 [Thermosynechococcus sp. QKsg1]|uniref:hypothetical protein n=1 Tax=Thermosynechococcus sp. QKsg1 TaxID=3074130 RepID=UPI0028776041|nr:hypothetical protein [Thermosynechococcus sp. QKsg1]WNC87986.1 hypothetical protein RHP47_06580 [Thermosynechococcus sp. QKsg1]